MADGGNSGVWKEKRARTLPFFCVDGGLAGISCDWLARLKYSKSVMAITQNVRDMRSRSGRMVF